MHVVACSSIVVPAYLLAEEAGGGWFTGLASQGLTLSIVTGSLDAGPRGPVYG